MNKSFAKTSVLFVIAIIFANICLCSCGSSEKKEVNKPLFTAEDTTAVFTMIDQFLGEIQAKNYDQAFNQLKEWNGQEVVPMSDEKKATQKSFFESFPVLNYSLKNMVWNVKDPLLLTYDIAFFEVEPGSNIPNTYKLNFSPRRINGTWYLLLEDKN